MAAVPETYRPAPHVAAGPAAAAAARVWSAGALLGGLGLASSAFVVLRLLETWRVSGTAASHHVSIVGQRLAYPIANLAAVVVLGLALIGLVVAAMTVRGALREAAASIRFARRIARERPAPLGDGFVIEDERVLAFCAGLLRPRVYVSTGALAQLDERALEAVMAHERHHARRRDPLRLAAGRVLARALFFMPGLDRLLARQLALAELSADESAIHAARGNRSALARAMLSFSSGIHPSRVDHLLGDAPDVRFPLTVCVMACAAIVLVIATALLAGRVAAGSATLALPFLSAQPCVLMLALIPATAGCVALRLRRRIRRR